MQNNSNIRILWLDSLRGIAALMVAIMHWWEVMRNEYYTPTHSAIGNIADLFISDCLNFGKVGIVIFFIISGYVIPFSLRKNSLKKFAVTRFFRLYPAYWVSILLYIILMGLPPTIILLSNITMFQKFWGISDLVGVYWTLQIELIFYILCAYLKHVGFLFKTQAISNIFLAILLIALIASTVRYLTDKKLPIALFLGIALMFYGMLLRLKHDEKGKKTEKLNFFIKELAWFIIILVPICFLSYNKDFGYHETWYKYLISYIIGLFFFFIFSQTSFSGKFWSYIGNISYSLYLLHPVVGLLYLNKLNTYTYFSLISYSCYYFVIIFITSTMCYFLVEKNMINLGKRVSQNM